jgi:hypothetical protein
MKISNQRNSLESFVISREVRNLLEVEGKQRFLPEPALSIIEGAVMTSASGLRETAPPQPLEG